MVTLVVEDGTGLTNANSYISLADANTYFSDRDNNTWAGQSDARKTQSLFNATIALDGLYQSRYMSQKIYDSRQRLQFPRYVFWDRYHRRYDQGEIPQPLKDAQCEIALLDLQGIDIFPEERTDIHVIGGTDTVGELSSSTTYKQTPSAERVAWYEGFRKIDILLEPILKTKIRKIEFTR